MIRMVLTSVLMLLVLTSTALSQFSYDFTGTGARAQGMGNAFIAVSNDASAASWNPAGMTVHEKLLMGLDYDSYSPDNKFRNGTLVFQENPSFSSVSQFSLIAPFRFRGSPMVFGLSYGRGFQEYWNDGTRGSGIYINEALGIIRDSSEQFFGSVSEKHSSLKVLNIAVGTKLSPRLSAGGSINIYSGQSVGNSLSFDSIPHFTNDQLGGDQYVDHLQTIEVIDTAKFSGANFTLGLKFEGEQFDLGLMVRTPFDLKSESDMKINFRTVENYLLQRVGSDTVYFDDQLTKTGIPWIIGLGAAMHPGENLTLAVDVEYRGFSGQQVKVRDSIYIRPGSANEEFFTVYDLNNNNSTSLRLGFEYLWHSPWESFPIIPIRLGFSSVSLPANQLAPDIDPNDGVPAFMVDKSSTTNIHVGLGIRWSQIYLDAAYTYSTLDMPSANFDAGWDNSSSRLVFGFTGYF